MNDQRLIDANALKEHKYYDETRHEYCVPVYNIDTAPTIGLKRGEWTGGDEWRKKCSLCGFTGSIYDIPINPFNFCPNCGADMRGAK